MMKTSGTWSAFNGSNRTGAVFLQHCASLTPATLAGVLAAAFPPPLAADSTIPKPPSSFYVAFAPGYSGYQLNWTNPSENTDGTLLDDFGGIRIYRNGTLFLLLVRPRGAAGRPDSATDIAALLGATYWLSAIDRSSPPNESSFTRAVTGPGLGPSGISVTPDSLWFSVYQGFSGRQALTVGNIGSDSLDFSAAADQPWLSLQPSSGSLPAGTFTTVFVTADATQLSTGDYAGAVNVSSNDVTDSLVVVTVTLQVVPPPPPRLRLEPATLSFELRQYDTSEQTLVIANDGYQILNYALSDTFPWLEAGPSVQSVPPMSQVSVTVSVDAVNILPGQYQAELHASTNDPGSPVVAVPVTVMVLPPHPPDLQVTPASLALFTLPGGRASDDLYLYNAGLGAALFSLSHRSSWLGTSPGTGTVAGGRGLRVSVQGSSGTLAEGTYDDTLSVASNDPDMPVQHIPVRFTVSSRVLEVVPDTVVIHASWAGELEETEVELVNIGTNLVGYYVSLDRSWMSFYPCTAIVSRSSSRTLEIGANPMGLSPGTYVGHVSIMASIGTLSLTVILEIAGEPPELVVAPDSLKVRRVEGSQPVTMNVLLENTGSDPLVFSVQSAATSLKSDCAARTATAPSSLWRSLLSRDPELL
jgi:hypothetical protein